MAKWKSIETAPMGVLIYVWALGEDESLDAFDDEREAEYAAYPVVQGPQPESFWLHGCGLKQIEDPTHWREAEEGPAS